MLGQNACLVTGSRVDGNFSHGPFTTFYVSNKIPTDMSA